MSDYPRVIPVLVYWRYWTEHRDDYEDWDFDNEWDIVALAYRHLEFRSGRGPHRNVRC